MKSDKKEITPEIQFKRELTSLFNDNSPYKVFQRISCTVKNKYMFWYNHGYTSKKDIKRMLTDNYDVVEGKADVFYIMNQPLKCSVKIIEGYHTIEIQFV